MCHGVDGMGVRVVPRCRWDGGGGGAKVWIIHFVCIILQEDKIFLCELFTQIQDPNTSEGQFQELVCIWVRGLRGISVTFFHLLP